MMGECDVSGAIEIRGEHAEGRGHISTADLYHISTADL